MPKKKGHPELSRLAGQQNWAIGRLLARQATIKAWIDELKNLNASCVYLETELEIERAILKLESASEQFTKVRREVLIDFERSREQLQIKLDLDKEKQDGNIS
jgi:hypothetical protein